MTRRIKVFPFWGKQYLFHPEATRNPVLQKLYQPYYSLAKVNWWLWKNSSLYQNLFSFDWEKDKELHKFISMYLENDSEYIWALNRGSKSIYQKITGLLIPRNHPQKGFFLKWGQSDIVIEHLKNEIALLEEFKEYDFIPHVIFSEVTENEALYKAEIIRGSKCESLKPDSKVLELMSRINNMKPMLPKDYCLSDKLHTSFQHGDFCPWNLIIEEHSGLIKVIDWEFCGTYPKGFDFLSYVFLSEMLVKKNTSLENIIDRNDNYISGYFASLNISDWKPYLKEFALICMERYSKEDDLREIFRELSEISA